MAGIVMIDRDPVEFCSEIRLHLLHQTARGLARVGHFHPFLGGDDETELVPVIAAAVQEGATILHVALARVNLPLLAILRHAVTFEIAEVRVHCLGADELPSAGGSALRVELHHASLHRYSPHQSLGSRSKRAANAAHHRQLVASIQFAFRNAYYCITVERL